MCPDHAYVVDCNFFGIKFLVKQTKKILGFEVYRVKS